MKIKNAWYHKQLTFKIVLEFPDGTIRMTDTAPFRIITEKELEPLAYWNPAGGDEIPNYILRFYGLELENFNTLRWYRTAAAFTQAELARTSGINIRQIQKLESGEIKMENITLATAAKLADVFGIEIDKLLQSPFKRSE